jgi:hypothetical protein
MCIVSCRAGSVDTAPQLPVAPPRSAFHPHPTSHSSSSIPLLAHRRSYPIRTRLAWSCRRSQAGHRRRQMSRNTQPNTIDERTTTTTTTAATAAVASSCTNRRMTTSRVDTLHRRHRSVAIRRPSAPLRPLRAWSTPLFCVRTMRITFEFARCTVTYSIGRSNFVIGCSVCAHAS